MISSRTIIRLASKALIAVLFFNIWPGWFDLSSPAPLTFAATRSTFTATTSDTTFAVPTGTTEITIKCWGAGGGGGAGGDNAVGRVGGAGGYATGVATTTSGESLTVRVGGFGSGGRNTTAAANDDGAGGGGAGYSAVLRGTTILIQCPGGGGGGGSSDANEFGGAGGAGGNTASSTTNLNADAYGARGNNGANAACGSGVGEGGGGGTVGAAGLGGAGCSTAANGSPGTANTGGQGGANGTTNPGGAAGNNGGAAGGAGSSSGPGGGGGGGGVFGGGGGEAGVAEGGGGGGGGAAFFHDLISATSTEPGSGATAPNTSDTDYTGSVAAGGGAGAQDGNGGNGGDGYVVIIYDEPTLQQAAYRWFPNVNSTAVGDAPVQQNTPTVAPPKGTPFRLRLLLHLTGGGSVSQSATSSLLQFGAKNGGACSTASYSTISDSSGDIRFHNNAGATDGAALTAHRLDPRHASSTAEQASDIVNNQNYVETAANFANAQSAINGGEDALWDFALVDISAPPSITYCFRAIQNDGGALLTGYDAYPELTTTGLKKATLRGSARLRNVRLR